MTRRRLVPCLGVALAALAGCGGSGGKRDAGSAGARSPAAVIRAWSDSLRGGRVEQATAYFALPVVVANGTPPRQLRTRAQVRAFNGSLPCGARLLRTSSRGRYTVAMFRLTDRRGGDCGRGTGQVAYTAFAFRDGRISAWLRVLRPARRPPPTGQIAA